MVELGRYALYLLPVFSAYAIGAAAFGALTSRPLFVKSAERAVYAAFALLLVTFAGLIAALLGDRFDLAFVAASSSREQHWAFKLAIWGGQEGSLVLWASILALMSCLAVFQNRARNRALMPWVVVSLMTNLLFFALLLCLVSDPFEVVPGGHALSNGRGMNPLLQHPVMMIHPPILYTGFVGFAVPFSFALAALVTGQLDTTWFRTTRRWTLTAWTFLGVGILLGGRWAYEVLGWGGYWAWDPVENASLMPWLAATPYLHSVIIQEKRGMLKIWNLALIGLTYSLCVFGTFLTRSGVVQSVHSFADAGWFGTLFLGYVVLIAGSFFGLLIWRVPLLRSQTRLESMVSRESSFLFNNYVFLMLLAVVLFGTLAPVFSQYIYDTRIQIGPPFFQRWSGPLAIALLILTGIGPLIAWRRASLVNLRKSFVWPLGFALVTGILLAAFGMRSFYPWAFFTLCAFVIGTICEEYFRAISARMRHGENALRAFRELLNRNQRRYAGYVVHLAIVLMFIGFGGAAFDLEATKLMQPGERWQLRDYTIEYRGLEPVTDPHFRGVLARLALWRGETPVTMLEPEKRMYYQQGTPTTLPAVSSNLREDVYVILAGLEGDRAAALKVFINPLVNWIWIGGFVFVFGNALLLWPVPERASRRES
jgi:cytochrome c-type biogenesis protein CcmF